MASVNPANDSDEVHEMFCEQCDDHGVYAVACGFCVECLEYMCEMCMVYHNRYVPSHTQRDKYTMPQDFCLEKCASHQDKVIKFYCQKCDQFACTKCKQKDHKSCNVGHIPLLVQCKALDARKEATISMEMINNMTELLDGIQEQIDQNCTKVLSDEKDAKSKIQLGIKEKKDDFKRQAEDLINSFDRRMYEIITKLKKERQEKVVWLQEKKRMFEAKLNEWVKTAEHEIGKSVIEETTKLNGLNQECKKTADDMKSLRYTLEQKQKIGQQSSIFVTAKQIQPNVTKCQERIKKITENNTTSYYEIDFEGNPLSLECTNVTHSILNIGKIVKSTEASVAVIPKTNLNLQSKAITFSSLCFPSENKLVVANYKHSNLFVFNALTSNAQANVVNLSSSPWDITKIREDQIAVTLPNARSIRLLDLSAADMNQADGSICVEGKCYGIAHINDTLVVSFLDPAEIRVINFEGIVINKSSC